MESTSPTVRKPHLIIKPSTGWQSLNLREIWQFRDLLFTLAVRDIKLRYRQTALGAIWVVLQPLVAAGLFSFVFGKVAKLKSDGTDYFLFSYAGMLGWNLFSGAMTRASGCLVGSAHLVSKVYFPRLILPLSTIYSVVIDFGVAFVMLCILMVTKSSVPHFGILLLPIWSILLLMLALGIGLYASALMVTYRDVQHVLPVVSQFLLYASPVAYSVSSVPESMRAFFYINPIAGLISAFRWSILPKTDVAWGYVAYSAAVAVVLFVTGAFAFKKMERKFADII
jgi:lipopolysaccharide transport system permease protein